MGFGKSFGLGLLLYMLLNFGLFIVVIAVISPGMIGLLFSDFTSIILLLVMPAAIPAGSGIVMLGSLTEAGPLMLMMLFMAIWLILPGLLGALVAGKSSDSAGAAFGGWFLVPIVCAAIIVVLGLVIPGLDLAIAALGAILGGGLSVGSGMITILLVGVTNSFFWGGIAAVTAGP